MKVLSVAGTRPNIIQEMLLNRLFRECGIEEVLVHSGQHWDYRMSQTYFEEFSLPTPNYHLSVSSGRPARQIGEMMTALEEIIANEQPDVSLLHGDVNSTLAAAIASARARVPVAHIEAGLRTPFLYNPEEINRRLTDHISELLFPHIREAYESLLLENFSPANIFLVGDIVNDTLQHVIQRFNIVPQTGDYLVATVHREENTRSPERLRQIVTALAEAGERVVFPVHPNTRNKLKQYNLIEELAGTPVELVEPMKYREFIELLAGSRLVVTDSGGARREAYILGKPVVVAVELNWVPSMVKCGWSVIAGTDREAILEGIRNLRPPAYRPDLFGDGHAAEKIVEVLQKRLG
jgi:UDP-GlcNAc3NAcA epimerase